MPTMTGLLSLLATGVLVGLGFWPWAEWCSG